MKTNTEFIRLHLERIRALIDETPMFSGELTLASFRDTLYVERLRLARLLLWRARGARETAG